MSILTINLHVTFVCVSTYTLYIKDDSDLCSEKWTGGAFAVNMAKCVSGGNLEDWIPTVSLVHCQLDFMHSVETVKRAHFKALPHIRELDFWGDFTFPQQVYDEKKDVKSLL